MTMTPERWANTCSYLVDVFGKADAHLDALMGRAVEAGLPDIAVSGDVGRLLMILTSLTRARLAIELGTLAGYSGTWIARGLAPGGRLITVEPEPKHADFAQKTFNDAGVADRVQIRRQTGLDALAGLSAELEPGSVDVLFLDAIKSEYPDYFRAGRGLIAVGGLLIADNALGSGADWWIDSPPGSHPNRDGADALNRMLADDPDFEAACVPIREGVLIARRVT